MSPRDPAEGPETREKMIRNLLGLLKIREEVGDIHLRSVSSPWDEKIRLKQRGKKQGGIDISLWDGEEFLCGRIYRLLLYVSDALDPRFLYRSEEKPRGSENRRSGKSIITSGASPLTAGLKGRGSIISLIGHSDETSS